MKKIVFLFVILFLFRCEDIPSEVIDAPAGGYNLAGINLPDTLVFSPAEQDYTVAVSFSQKLSLDNVKFQILSEDGKIEMVPLKELRDNGNQEKYGDAQINDGIYCNKIALSQSVPNGYYQIIIFVYTKITEKKIAAIRKFYYDNNSVQYNPVLSDLSCPAQVNVNTSFDFSIKATDGNGNNDVKRVYYRLFKPDGTQQQNSKGEKEFEMYDDGSVQVFDDENTSHDLTAGNNIYTSWLNFPGTVPIGNWRIEFEAVDRAGNKSEIIQKIVEIRSVQYNPVLSDLSCPAQVNVNTPFDFSIKATDGNGNSDIKRVYYRLFKPDGTQQQNSKGEKEFEMYDDGSLQVFGDGNTSHDLTAGNNIYTSWLNFPGTVPKGNWRIEFEAVDRSGNKSEIIQKIVEVR